MNTAHADVAIVGAGAAGLATALFAARLRPGLRPVVLDGARRPGAKILVSGGGRCNVTNRVVTPDDYWGGSRHLIRRILASLPVADTIAFFRDIGVSLYEDYAGKLFPTTDSARTVLEALLNEAHRLHVDVLGDHRVTAIAAGPDGFVLTTPRGPWTADRLVLATGGLSLPKTGSDGAGYAFARALGHSLVPTTPGLAPLLLAGDFHAPLSGISLEAELSVRRDGEKRQCVRGPLLWTHFGVSGPAAMDASRIWHRARLDAANVTVTANFLPGLSFESAEKRWLDLVAAQPRSRLGSVVAGMIPARMAAEILRTLQLPADVLVSNVPREDRRRLINALLEWPLPVTDSRGYAHAEVTAGGVPLDEIRAATMESRRCPGLYLVGEILDCDGRIGGFNFQWAWATGFIAGRALAQRAADHARPVN